MGVRIFWGELVAGVMALEAVRRREVRILFRLHQPKGESQSTSPAALARCNREGKRSAGRTPAKMAVADITVGKRHRRDMGDLGALAASIRDVGLLHPIVTDPKSKLIAGERRLEAAKLLGWQKVFRSRSWRSTTSPAASLPINTARKDFTLSEAVAIKHALEPIERAEAKRRMLGGKPSGKLPKGRAGDKAAKATGMARRTLEKAEAVVAAAEAEPEKYGKLLVAMDKTGRVNGSIQEAQGREAGRADPCRAATASRQWAVPRHRH